MKEIPLTKGHVALVDDDWFPVLSKWSWYAAECSGKMYACRDVGGRFGKQHVYMHRYILMAPDIWEVDHIDGDGMNNQESNLRTCISRQNKANRGPASTNTSGFKGVSFDKNRSCWIATIQWQRKQYNLGRFATKEDAARAYNAKARELHGDFAYQNPV